MRSPPNNFGKMWIEFWTPWPQTELGRYSMSLHHGTWGHQWCKQCSTTLELKATVSNVITPVFWGEGQERIDPLLRALPRMTSSPSQSFDNPCKEVPSIGASSPLAASSSLAASSEAMGRVTETRVTGQAMLFSQKVAVTKKFPVFQVLNSSQRKRTMGYKERKVGHWLVIVQLKLSHRHSTCVGGETRRRQVWYGLGMFE